MKEQRLSLSLLFLCIAAFLFLGVIIVIFFDDADLARHLGTMFGELVGLLRPQT